MTHKIQQLKAAFEAAEAAERAANEKTCEARRALDAARAELLSFGVGDVVERNGHRYRVASLCFVTDKYASVYGRKLLKDGVTFGDRTVYVGGSDECAKDAHLS